MTTDPRIEAAARALNTEGWTCQEGSDEPGSYGECEDCTRACDDLARAALAAADKAATITTEWGTGLGDEVMIWKDRDQAERQSASATATYDQGKTWVHTNPPVVFRTVTEWKEAPDDHPTA